MSTYGGGMHLGMVRSLLLSDSTFSNCSGTQAGALSIRQGSTVPSFVQETLRITRCTFANNRAVRTGGSVVLDAVTTGVEFLSCTFVNSTAGASSGGAVQLLASQMRITVDFGLCTFLRNEASRGGAIFASSVQLNVYSTTFSHTYGRWRERTLGWRSAETGQIASTDAFSLLLFCFSFARF